MTTLGEQAKHASMSDWALQGPNQVLKIVNTSTMAFLQSAKATLKEQDDDTISAPSKGLAGCVCLRKALCGKTGDQIERTLGLRPGELRPRAYVLAFKQLPTASEIEYLGTCDKPMGQEFDVEDALEKRRDFAEGKNLFAKSHVAVPQYWPPGDKNFRQWRLVTPVPIVGYFAVVTPFLPFPDR